MERFGVIARSNWGKNSRADPIEPFLFLVSIARGIRVNGDMDETPGRFRGCSSGWRLPRARFPRLKESVLALTQGKLDGGSRLLSFQLGSRVIPLRQQTLIHLID